MLNEAISIVDAAARAAEHDRCCELCEHRCQVDRTQGPSGRCHASNEARVFRHRIEYGEERELLPCHLFYLSGCDLRCKFCIAERFAFDARLGTPLTGEFLETAVAWGRDQGARTLQWVGGEPTIHLPAVLRSMAALPALPRIVWKSDFYGTPAAFELLEGVVDVYVADFKFGNDACARAIAGVDRYFEVITRNLHQAAGQGDLIVRHLLLPGHMDCCFRRVVAWMAESLPRAKFSLRDGYRPHWTAKNDASLSRSIAADERAAALRLARSAHLNLVA